MTRTELSLRMELLSDAIFGAGFSVPGGEDISVYTDAEGYPFFKATSLKGLLKESLANLLSWKELPSDHLDRLLGVEGWEGTDDGSRLFLSNLTLVNRPEDPDACYARRRFTSLENGIVKEGTLREAVCISAGQVFEGTVSCAEEDAELVSEALSLIKWAGSSRNRGFGEVSLRCTPAAAAARKAAVSGACCIRYILHTELPLIVTKLSSSSGNGYETRNYIPGSAIRGFVVGKLAQESPDWFRENKEALLSESTRFLNAFPTPSGKPAIPSLMGFYEDKAESKFQSVVRGQDITGLKRAKIGSFCAPEGKILKYWSTDTDGYTRIDRSRKDDEDKTLMFQTRHISAGQDFTGYILLDSPALAEAVSAVFTSEIWIGADRYEGFGKCRLKVLEAAEEPACFGYGYGEQDRPDPVLYMTLLSPACMLDDKGEPCGLNLADLAKALGVREILADKLLCSTSVSEYGAYNRRWACREPAVRMYDSGSVFRLVCDSAPSAEALRTLQRSGIGIRRAEGFGQVLFLRKALYEGLERKESLSVDGGSAGATAAAAFRRAKMSWVMDHVSMLQSEDARRKGLSRSQVGNLQTLCEQAIADNDADAKALRAFLEKNLKDKTAVNEHRYREISKLIEKLLSAPLTETLKLSNAPDDALEKLRLLVMLFDHSRK